MGAKSVLKNGTFQIITAVIIAIIVGVAINKTVGHVPEVAVEVLKIPGALWLRALGAIVVPLILCSMISSMQSLKKIPGDGQNVAKVAITYYLLTTIFALILSLLCVYIMLTRRLLFILA